MGKRQAATGTDFARAVVGLGIERGISSFQRFGFLKRNGLAFIATPLGRFRVDPKPEANLLFDLDLWLDRLRRAARGQNAPDGLGRAPREIDRAVLEFCAHASSGGQSARLLQEVLIAAGRAERWLATSRLKDSVSALSGLSLQWLQGCDDGSSEFRLAAALASIQGVGEVGTIRSNLEPVIFDRGRWQWAEDDTSVVWHGGDSLQAMSAVLERRCLEARMKGTQGVTARPAGEAEADPEEHPGLRTRWNGLPLWGWVPAPLADIHAFLEEQVDYQRITGLLLPLTAIRWQGQDRFRDWLRREGLRELPWYDNSPPPTFSRTYATLKLLLLPWTFRRYDGAEPVAIRAERSLIPLLRAGRIEDAYKVATDRLWVSGAGRALSSKTNISREALPRLTAALLIPIRQWDVWSPLSYQGRQTLSRMAFGPANQEVTL